MDAQRGSPQAIAATIMDIASVVGFGIVSVEPGSGARRVQVVQIVHAFKGAPGRHVMDSGYRSGDRYELTNSTGNLDARPGEIVFVALVPTPHGSVVSECTQQLLAAAPLSEIIAAVSELSQRSAH
jgi:hypothetical protein